MSAAVSMILQFTVILSFQLYFFDTDRYVFLSAYVKTVKKINGNSNLGHSIVFCYFKIKNNVNSERRLPAQSADKHCWL